MRGISRSGDWTWQERLNIKVARGDLLLFSVQSCENVRISKRRSHFFCLSDASNSSFPRLGIILEAKQKEDVHFVCFILSSSKHYKHKHQSIISIVHCSQGFKILLMDDANSCGVNTWRLEDNDDWLMNCLNHVLASLTHSIFPLLSDRFSCSAHNDPRVGGHALNHIKQPQITARSSNPCSTCWEHDQIIPTRWLKTAAVVWNKLWRFHWCDDAAPRTQKNGRRGRCVHLEGEICFAFRRSVCEPLNSSLSYFQQQVLSH